MLKMILTIISIHLNMINSNLYLKDNNITKSFALVALGIKYDFYSSCFLCRRLYTNFIGKFQGKTIWSLVMDSGELLHIPLCYFYFFVDRACRFIDAFGVNGSTKNSYAEKYFGIGWDSSYILSRKIKH